MVQKCKSSTFLVMPISAHKQDSPPCILCIEAVREALEVAWTYDWDDLYGSLQQLCVRANEPVASSRWC